MSNLKHTVVSGESLWSISRHTLGSGNQWRRIWRYNNRPDIIRVTGRGIPNPDLIYPGQILLIPSLPGVPHSVPSGSHHTEPPAPHATSSSSGAAASPQPLRSPSTGPLSSELPKIESPISLKYRLDDLRFP